MTAKNITIGLLILLVIGMFISNISSWFKHNTSKYGINSETYERSVLIAVDTMNQTNYLVCDTIVTVDNSKATVQLFIPTILNWKLATEEEKENFINTTSTKMYELAADNLMEGTDSYEVRTIIMSPTNDELAEKTLSSEIKVDEI